MEVSNVQKDVKPHIVLIDGVKYYSDKPETCRTYVYPRRRPFSGKTARFPAFSGRKTATISLKSFSLNSRRNARAAVTHPAAPA